MNELPRSLKVVTVWLLVGVALFLAVQALLSQQQRARFEVAGGEGRAARELACTVGRSAVALAGAGRRLDELERGPSNRGIVADRERVDPDLPDRLGGRRRRGGFDPLDPGQLELGHVDRVRRRVRDQLGEEDQEQERQIHERKEPDGGAFFTSLHVQPDRNRSSLP